MPLLKIKPADPMKFDSGNDSIDTFVKQTTGKEPYISFSRANENPVQWIQLLNALEQQELPGWSLLAPLQIQMQKCEKCSREFCSTIGYRRHMRLHRRKLNLDKDSATKIRGSLEAFWDKLTVEEAMEIMSFDDVSLAGVAGPAIIKALASFIRKLGYTSLPPSYVKSGSALLDIVQGRPPRFPISSQELFDILDGASENTFLCAGTAESLQKFVFDGDAGKVGLEMRNVVACTSFLVEQKLVKACLADKDAEALRHQKLLVEEEEAAQKRQAVLLEKKRQKKLRQKEQRAKELPIDEDDDSIVESSPSPPSSILVDDYESTREMLDIPLNAATPSPQPSQLVNVEEDTDKDQENRHPDYAAHQKNEHRTWHQGGRRQLDNSHWQAPKSHRNPNGFHTNHNYQALKPVVSQKRASSRNIHTAASSTKVWTPKPKSESHEEISKTTLLVDEAKLPCPETKFLIGSIPIPLGDLIRQGHDGNFGRSSENVTCERSVEGEGNEGTTNSSVVNPVMLLRAFNRRGNEGQLPNHNSSGDSEVGGVLGNDDNVVHPTLIVESALNGCKDECTSRLEAGHQGDMEFSSHEAEAFLSERWKEAVMGDHVELVLFAEEPAGHFESQDVKYEADLSSKVDEHSILRSSENRLPVCPTVDSSAPTKSKIRAKKPEKGSKVKYIEKQRSGF
ncbi:uncharacterized protein LOC141656630 [Silene latifolia]|uniref:uncharacterized protein LOC141656630 n=1 Tax=Silene latifolia TaxID=37657 RepID=UPI003D785D66